MITIDKSSDDYCVRIGYQSETARTDYDTFKRCNTIYEKLKKDNDVIWAEIIYEPLDEDNTYVIKAFEKEIIDLGDFGKMVANIKEENYE